MIRDIFDSDVYETCSDVIFVWRWPNIRFYFRTLTTERENFFDETETKKKLFQWTQTKRRKRKYYYEVKYQDFQGVSRQVAGYLEGPFFRLKISFISICLEMMYLDWKVSSGMRLIKVVAISEWIEEGDRPPSKPWVCGHVMIVITLFSRQHYFCTPFFQDNYFCHNFISVTIFYYAFNTVYKTTLTSTKQRGWRTHSITRCIKGEKFYSTKALCCLSYSKHFCILLSLCQVFT